MIDFYNFCTLVSRKKCFTHAWHKCPPRLNNVLTLPSENETSHFLQCTLSVLAYTLHQAWCEKWSSSTVQRKQFDSYKVCSKCPSLARVFVIGQLRHQSATVLSRDKHAVRRCRSSSMSWTLVLYTHCWMADRSTRDVATKLIRPQSGLSFSLMQRVKPLLQLVLGR